MTIGLTTVEGREKRAETQERKDAKIKNTTMVKKNIQEFQNHSSQVLDKSAKQEAILW